MSALLEAQDEATALEQLHELGCTDGLPVVIPTADRVSRMVLASGQDADMVLGKMGPGHGVATIEKVAVAAVPPSIEAVNFIFCTSDSSNAP